MRRSPQWWIAIAFAVLLAPTSAHAQKPKKAGTAAATTAGDEKPRPRKARVFDFGAYGIEGSMRTPQLLYFLGRARQELDRASLEKRSFMPELARSVDEGGL